MGTINSFLYIILYYIVTFFVLFDRFCPTVNVLFRDERIAKICEHPRDANHGVCADERLGQEQCDADPL